MDSQARPSGPVRLATERSWAIHQSARAGSSWIRRSSLPRPLSRVGRRRPTALPPSVSEPPTQPTLDPRGPTGPSRRAPPRQPVEGTPASRAGPSHGLRGQARSCQVVPFYAATAVPFCSAIDILGESSTVGGLARRLRGALGLAARRAPPERFPGHPQGRAPCHRQRDKARHCRQWRVPFQGKRQLQPRHAHLSRSRRPGLRAHQNQSLKGRAVALHRSRGTAGGLAKSGTVRY